VKRRVSNDQEGVLTRHADRHTNALLDCRNKHWHRFFLMHNCKTQPDQRNESSARDVVGVGAA
jgi:hypothetical protein